MGRPVHSLMVAIVGIGPANTASAYEYRISNIEYRISNIELLTVLIMVYFIFSDLTASLHL